MKRFLKIIGILLGLVILGGIITGLAMNEDLPEGKKGLEADALANKMLTALNQDSFKKTEVIQWSFRNGAHNYVWNKKDNICKVGWEDYEVTLDLQNPKQSIIKKVGEITEAKRDKIIKKAQDLFNNDSFWLVAPYKVFDTGTERRLVKIG